MKNQEKDKDRKCKQNMTHKDETQKIKQRKLNEKNEKHDIDVALIHGNFLYLRSCTDFLT